MQHPPGERRTPDQNDAFSRALDVMADVYASAVGTTVLQLKEIPARPAEFDGAVCLFDLATGKDEAAIRAQLQVFGEIASCDLKVNPVTVRFATHAAALAAKHAGLPSSLCASIDMQYNERSYDGRQNDVSGRDDDDGRGWCASASHSSSANSLA